MGSALFNRISATGLRNSTIAIGPSNNRVADLCFQDCVLSYNGKASADFTWPPYGLFASDANRVQIINSKFWYNNAEDRGVATITYCNTGVMTGLRYKATAATPLTLSTVTTVSQSNNAAITTAPTIPLTFPTHVRIKSRWKGNYLYDAGDRVSYGTGSGDTYLWEIIYVDGLWRQFKNKVSGEMMHVENLYDYVQCNVPVDARWSSMWRISPTDATWRNLGNRWQIGNYAHEENQYGYLQHKNAQNGWWSAQWELAP
jgi:hypothetical protein